MNKTISKNLELLGKASGKEHNESAHSRGLAIGGRIRQIREERGLSQGDIEKKTGLLRCYTSRVENGFKVPRLDTLERFASALDVPLYRLFYTGEEPPPTSRLTPRLSLEDLLLEETRRGPDAPFHLKLARIWNRMGNFERQVVMHLAKSLATRKKGVDTQTHGGATIKLKLFGS